MTKTGHVYTPKDSADYRTRVRNAAEEAMNGRLLYDCPMAIFIAVTVQAKTTGWKKGEREWLDNGGLIIHAKKPDVDNVIKQIADACNGVIWVDDSLIVCAKAIKLMGREPRCDVWVWPESKLFWTRESLEELR